jgi:hypothetical protein
MVGKGCRKLNMVLCSHVKMILVKTISKNGWRVEQVKLCIIYLIYCKNFYKCYNVTPSTIKKWKK